MGQVGIGFSEKKQFAKEYAPISQCLGTKKIPDKGGFKPSA